VAAFADFQVSEKDLAAMPPLGMSALAERILEGIDYDAVRQTRLENFRMVHGVVGERNELADVIEAALGSSDFVPFSYPLLCADGAALREALIEQGIYVPHLWGGLSDRAEMTKFERHLADATVHLPIDQRYTVVDMEEMLTRGKLLAA
jgi:hypothetical protein